ncbi:serine protease 30 [Octopus bimaculoides]|nr:serine protease 30 [Octopus bimaculoides]
MLEMSAVNCFSLKYYLYVLIMVFIVFCPITFAQCPTTGTSWVRDENNCSKYYVCLHGKRISMPPCPHRTVYSLLTHSCVWQNSHADDCSKEISTTKRIDLNAKNRQNKIVVRKFPSRKNRTHILHHLIVRTTTATTTTTDEPTLSSTWMKSVNRIVNLSSGGIENNILQSNYTSDNDTEIKDSVQVDSDMAKKHTDEKDYYYFYYYDSEDSENNQFDSDDYSWEYNNADYDDDWSEDVDEGSCGYSISPFIIGGGQAAEGTWPWQVSLQVLTDPPAHRCGGVLVHPSWILTAAHCVYGTFNSPQILQVVLADNDLINDSGFEVYRYVDEIVIHPDYVPAGGYPNDIALVKLSAPVNPFENFVNTVCVPGQEEVFDENDDCYMTGWGATLGTGYRWVLNELATDIRTTDYCQTMWKKNYVEYSHLCVGNGETGACQGDSGGPLMCARNGQMFVVGIASWAVIGCRRDGYPNMFTKVSSYSDWIFTTIAN